jgi:cobalt-zinc-cadmium efflux system protein
LADEEGEKKDGKAKPAPPRIRIRSSEPLDEDPREKPAAPAKEVPPPPLSSGSDLDVKSKSAYAKVVVARDPSVKDAPDEAPRKPPPPHAGKAKRPPPEPLRAIPTKPSEPRPAEPVRVSARPPEEEAPDEAPTKAVAVAKETRVAPDHEHQEAAAGATPHIGTDPGRMGALKAAMLIVLAVFLIEVLAGLASGSLALLSDATHSGMDFLSYGIAFAAVIMSQRRSNPRDTFGGHRTEVVAAFISGILLLLAVAGIWYEAAQRLGSTREVNTTYMLTVPWIPVLGNLYLARRMSGASDLNIEGARLHVLNDLLSSIGVIIGGLMIAATGNPAFDPVISLFIGFLIFVGAVRLLRESADILLERTPMGVNMDEVVDRVCGIEGVDDVHAVHLWSLCSTVHAMSAHIVATPAGSRDVEKLLAAARDEVARHFQVAFTTFQVEVKPCGAERHPTVAHSAADAGKHVHA